MLSKMIATVLAALLLTGCGSQSPSQPTAPNIDGAMSLGSYAELWDALDSDNQFDSCQSLRENESAEVLVWWTTIRNFQEKNPSLAPSGEPNLRDITMFLREVCR